MAHAENTLKDFKKENLISLVLNLQSDRDKVIDTLGQHIDNLTSTVDNLSSKLAQAELSSLERGLHSQEQYSRRESLEVVGIPSSVDDKNLQSTVCSIFGKIDVVCCDSNDIEDCHRIKGDRTIINFSSQRKSSQVLNKKKKLKNLDTGKYGFNDGSRIYINESLCPYYRGLWGKCKGFWQDKVIASFYTINGKLKNLSMINQLSQLMMKIYGSSVSRSNF